MRKAGILTLVAMAVVVVCVAASMVTGGAAGIKAYDDVRPNLRYPGAVNKDLTKADPAEVEKLAPTFWYNQDTVWPNTCKALAAKLLEDSKSPGLGVGDLHKSGITGKGVNVAIIDQPLFDDHPEFTGKIAAYKNLCTGEGSDTSMHGPAVASLLVGKTIGTAPGAKLYFVAAPSWLADAAYYAKAIEWIIEQNTKLPKAAKIRVVSVSAAPSGPGSPFEKNNDQWDAARERAENAGILVLDCTEDHGIIGGCSYGTDPEKPNQCVARGSGNRILAPTSPRTTAEEYTKGVFKYQRTGSGGLSWAIPYVSGVLAMGWQVAPELSNEKMISLLKQSACEKDGCKIIDPVAFLKLVKAQKG